MPGDRLGDHAPFEGQHAVVNAGAPANNRFGGRPKEGCDQG